MTLYYTLVFLLMVVEMAGFFVIALPLPFNLRRRLFRLISTSELLARTQYTLKIVFVFILILFIDSVNRVYRVQLDAATHGDRAGAVVAMPADRAEGQARRFYSQRNMYLCGFTLFLSVILNRTYVLVVELLETQDKLAAATKNSASASTVETLTKERDTAIKDLEAMKAQSEGLAREYAKLGDQVADKTAETKKDA
ncbi:B-cell receptor-associated protein 31-like-domain-containing protein [Limtongia smithiae]|uniref:B-cell receptor-associated protein 31-like-domain-containing protein n=1 Tax=Limtongia smithiae TaxID=1125753 RepID=UPI0034CF668F